MASMGFQQLLAKVVPRVREGKTLSLYGFEPAFKSPQKGRGLYQSREVIMRTSNNNLWLANHPAVKEVMKTAVNRFGTSTCASRMHNGTTVIHKQCEGHMTDFFGTSAP